MKKDTLFLIEPGFFDNGKGPYFCPGCAEILGFLELYPDLKQHLEIRSVEFQRPRPALVELLGNEYQSCPVLVLKAPPLAIPHAVNVQSSGGYPFIDDVAGIEEYLAHVHGVGIPH